MKLEFDSAEFSHIGGNTSKPDAMWSQLELRFKDTETDRFVSAQLVTFVPKRPDVTLAELQSVARDHSMTILREALACLEANDVAALEKMARD